MNGCHVVCTCGPVRLSVGGRGIGSVFQLPFPGALLGALLLLLGLLLYGRLPQALEQTSQTLLQNMMLLFIPTISGVMLHFDRIAKEWQPFLVAGVAGAAITFVVTALTFKWMLARSPAQSAHRGSSHEPPERRACRHCPRAATCRGWC